MLPTSPISESPNLSIPPRFSHISGIAPEREFPLRYTSFNVGTSPTNKGTPKLPKRLKLKSKNSKLCNPPKLSGILQPKALKLKSSFKSRERFPSESGKQASNLFPLRSRTLSLFRSPKLEGISPLRLFLDKVTSSKLRRAPI